VFKNEQGQQYFLNQDGKVQIINDALVLDDESDVEEHSILNGLCKLCKTRKTLESRPSKYNESGVKANILQDENMKNFIIDPAGSKKLCNVNSEGQMYYLDSNDKIVFVIPSGKTQKITSTDNDKLYNKLLKKFQIDD